MSPEGSIRGCFRPARIGMKIGIIGFGSIGRRHLANIRRIIPEVRIVVCHLHSRSTELPEGADEVVQGLEELARCSPDVAFITSPANTHIRAANAMLDCGADLFMEKPFSDTLQGVAELVERSETAGKIVMTGYVLRFHDSLQVIREAVRDGMIGRILCVRAEVGQYLPEWRPAADYRASVTARRELGGGVLLELSHEFDYLRWILGEFSAVSAQTGQLGDLEIDVEDTAEVILTSSRREIVSVHLDMVQRAGDRSCKITGSEGTLAWRPGAGKAEVYRAGERTWSDLPVPAASDRNDMFLREVQHFFDCVATRQRPLVDGRDGLKALEIVEAARRSSVEGRVVELWTAR